MSNMLHIVNGDSALALIKQTPIQGTFLIWKDMLMEGPVREGTDGELDWKARGAFLKNRFGIDAKAYLSGIKTFFAALERAAQGGEEVTFWFEEDFFCQIHLIYLLAHLPAPLLRKGRAFVICPDKPLGIRMPGSMERLYNTRTPLEPARVTLARKVWKAFALATSDGWESLLHWAQSGDGFAAWPLLQRGLRCHLGRRPAPDGGLNPLEAAMLRALVGGTVNFPQFFRRTWNEPQVRPLGLGDIQIARYALDFASQRFPLLEIAGPGSSPKPGEPIVTKDWKLRLTADGRALFSPMKNPASKDKPKAAAKPKAIAKVKKSGSKPAVPSKKAKAPSPKK